MSSEALRVTVVGLNYAPEPTGIAPYTASLARSTVAGGHEVTVICSHPHYPQWRRDDSALTDFETAGVRVERRTHYIPSSPRGLRRLWSEVSFGMTSTLARWRSPEVLVIVSPALFASVIAMVRARLVSRVRTIVWVQDLYSQGLAETGEGRGPILKIAHVLESWTLRGADGIVAIHPAMADRMVSDLKVDRDLIDIIPNWTHITPADVSRAEARRRLGWDPHGFIALHAGNMGAKQGLDNVVAAAREASDQGVEVSFVLLGDGSDRARLEELGHGIESLTFVAPLSGDDFPFALAAADALIVNEAPGVKEMAAPSKLTSYFAAGRPVAAAVASDGVVASIMAESQAGLVVGNEDPKELLVALDGLRADLRLQEQYGDAARSYWTNRLSASAALTAWKTIIEKC
ncbi:glycosyltransferase family 4 protein [Demequina sp. SO4-18]|uniref:glycosyltransferase family 4 protein n=1 Tax=Demequina sp. SO4-18 TaxID=3401026 RepID=UPI003B5B0182